MICRAVTTSIVLCLGITSAFAKEAPPAPAKPKAFKLPEVERISLQNGMELTLVPYGIVPKVTVVAAVRVGNANDGNRPQLSDMTGNLLSQGAAGKNAAQIATEAASMGGSITVGVGLDQTTITMDVLSERASDAVALISDVLQRPSFPVHEFERVKADVLRGLSVSRTQPGALASNALLGVMYPGHPYANAALPSDDAINAHTVEDVKAFHAANFGAKRTRIYVVGRFDNSEVKRAVESYFGEWASGPDPLEAPPGNPLPPRAVLIDRPGAVQSTVRLAKRVPPISGDLDLNVANTILGGYFSSRIVRNIREDKGYTYSPRSQVSIERDAAYWTFAGDITSEATGPAITEVLKEVRGLIETSPSEQELRGVKNYLNGVFILRLASRGGVANQIAFVDLHGLGLPYLESYVSSVEALTPAQVRAAASAHLALDQMSVIVIGDLTSVKPQLEAVPEIKNALAAP